MHQIYQDISVTYTFIPDIVGSCCCENQVEVHTIHIIRVCHKADPQNTVKLHVSRCIRHALVVSFICVIGIFDPHATEVDPVVGCTCGRHVPSDR